MVPQVEVNLSHTKLDEHQKKELQTLLRNFGELVSDKPVLTHAWYHEIDTGDNPPEASRPCRYDTGKQNMIDYHVNKMLEEGRIIPILSQSP
ncbi:hypothetical protein TNCV_2906671 [Trichonephila clavipes]|nr:hypothetical protein TNCV_2906671 [Trichonephila clavipes]